MYPFILIVVSSLCFFFGVALGSSFLMPSPSVDFYNMLGTWFAAVGTISASALALFFQFRAAEDAKPKLFYDFHVASLMSNGQEFPFLCFSIRSNGKQKIRIHSIYFELPDGKKVVPAIAPITQPFNSVLQDATDSVFFYFDKQVLMMQLARVGFNSRFAKIYIDSTLGKDSYILSQQFSDFIYKEVTYLQSLGHRPR